MFALCVLTSSIPQMDVQTFSMVFSIGAIIFFYVLRKKWATESFHYQETSYVIKTFWIWSTLYVAGMIVAGLLISTYGDMTALNQWAESMAQGGIPDEEELKRVTQDYMDTNFALMVKMTVLSILPAQIYAIWNIRKGLIRVLKPSPSQI